MKKRVSLLLVLFLSAFQLILAQGVWQNEAVLRKNEIRNNPYSYAHTSMGETFIMWGSGYEGCQGLFLRKLNQLGQPAWNEDIVLSSSYISKREWSICQDSLGNVFAKWLENQVLHIAKFNTDGLFLWQPALELSWGVNIISTRMLPDNNGGLHIMVSKYFGTPSIHNLVYQSLTPEGQPVLPDGGVQLTNETAQVTITDLYPASDNGLIIMYSYMTGSSPNRMLMRLLPDYTIDWQLSLNVFTPSLLSGTGVGMTPADSTNFIAFWIEGYSGAGHLFMQKFNEDGQAQFNPPLQLAVSTPFSSMELAFANDYQGSLYLAIHYGSITAPMANNLWKYDYNGVSQWTNPSVLPDSINKNFIPVPDNNGGCYVLSRSIINNDHSFYYYKFQHIDSSGQVLWPDGGLDIADPVPDLNGYMRYSYTDRFWFFWVNTYQDKKGIYFQIRNTDGQLISALRMTMNEGLTGDVTLKCLVARDNDLLACWSDSRDGTYRLYFRIVNTNGTMSQPEDGTLLYESASGYIYVQSVYLPNGNTVIIWNRSTTDMNYICGQSIDPDGNILWGLEGRTLVSWLREGSLSSLKISNDGNDVYIAWCTPYNVTQTRTFLQKIENGFPSWAQPGLLVDTGPVGTNEVDSPIFLGGRYLVVYKNVGNSTHVSFRAFRFESDGSLSTGWAVGGVVLGSYMYSNSSSYEGTGAVLDGNLYAFYYYASPDFRHYSYSVLLPDGTLAVNDQPLLNDPWDESGLTLDATDGLTYTLFLRSPQTYDGRIGYSKLDNLIEHPWTESAQTIYENGTSTPNMTSVPITGFGSGGYLANWFGYPTDYNIYGAYINSQGIFQSVANGELMLEKCKDVFYSVQLNNEVYIAWNDFKAAYFSYYTKEIRMQKFANLTFVDNSDEVMVPAGQLSCYPNPFNNILTIDVNSATKGKTVLSVYNLKGQKVTTITDEILERGIHTFTWNGKDSLGKQVASGIYYLRIAGNQGTELSKVLLMK